ncbi:MAG: hypothetical protein ABIH23_15050 [bacterium]
MPANLVKTAADERRWSEAKESYARAKGKRGKRPKNKWAYINAVFQKMKGDR